VAALQLLLIVAFPVAVYFALGVTSPRAIALCTLALLALRFLAGSRARMVAFARVFAPGALAFAATNGLALATNHPLALLLAPALWNFAMLGAFALSLARSESAIEILARAQVGELPADEVPYCRRVTLVWCAFFAANGAISAALALGGSRASWAVYNGALAYAGLGVLFAAEYLYRHWRFRRYVGAPTDALLRRLFPPKP
jgi:uncharacterized membrane protein